MALLKKIKAATLMETLVATVLIVLVFMIASMVLNSLFASSIRANEKQARAYLLHLQYQHQNGGLELPYNEVLDSWQIQVYQMEEQGAAQILFTARDSSIRKEIVLQQ